jgi:hypothetical protein
MRREEIRREVVLSCLVVGLICLLAVVFSFLVVVFSCGCLVLWLCLVLSCLGRDAKRRGREEEEKRRDEKRREHTIRQHSTAQYSTLQRNTTQACAEKCKVASHLPKLNEGWIGIVGHTDNLGFRVRVRLRSGFRVRVLGLKGSGCS